MILHAEINDAFELMEIRRKAIFSIDSKYYNLKQKKSWIEYNDITENLESLERKILDPSWKILVYKIYHKIVGYIAVDIADCLITSTYILPHYQKRGIGSLLIKEAINTIDSDVFVLSSKAAINLYLNNGFEFIEYRYMITISEQISGSYMKRPYKIQ